MDFKKLNNDAEIPPDIKSTDTELRLRLRPGGFICSILNSEYLFYDTYFLIKKKFFLGKEYSYPYSEIVGADEIKSSDPGRGITLKLCLQNGGSIKLGKLASADSSKIRTLIGL